MQDLAKEDKLKVPGDGCPQCGLGDEAQQKRKLEKLLGERPLGDKMTDCERLLGERRLGERSLGDKKKLLVES